MNKLLLFLLFFVLTHSFSQFRVITDVRNPSQLSENEEFNYLSLLDRVGVLYKVSNNLEIGIQSHMDQNIDYNDGNIDFVLRYLINDRLYVSFKSRSLDEGNYNLLGFVYSFEIFNNILIEPNVHISISESDPQKSDFNLGLSYNL